MRADQRALVALDALGDIPLGHVHRDAALLVLRGAGRAGAVSSDLGDRQLVAFLSQHGLDELAIVFVALDFGSDSAGGGVRPLSRNFDLAQAGDSDVDGVPVLLDDRIALLAVGLLGIRLHVLVRLIVRDHVSELEESSLHDGVDAVAHANLGSQIDSVDAVELDVLLGQHLLHGRRQVLVELRVAPLAVQQERAAVLQCGQHVVLRDIRRIVAGREVRRVNLIRRLDRRLAEAQMGNRQAAGLLGVVCEVSLSVHIGVVADDLDGVLVGANGAVRAEAIELAADRAFRSGVEDVAQRQAGVGDVVHDAHGEVVLRSSQLQVVEDSLHMGRRELLGAEAVAAADGLDSASLLGQSSHDVQVQRLAQGAGFLRAIQNGDLLHGCRQGIHKALRAERTIQVHAHEANLLAHGDELVDSFCRHVAAGAHGNDDILSIRRADIVERLVRTSGQLADLFHDLFHDGRGLCVVLVRSFTALEIDVRVLCGAAQVRMIRVQRTGAELSDLIPRHELRHVFVGDLVDLLDLMRGAEAIEEVQERHAALQCGKMRNQRHILRFLNRVGSDHGKAGLTAGHNVGMVTENRKRMISQRTGTHVENARKQLAGDLVHVRDHQQKALGRREGRRQRARLQRAVHGAGRAGFGLHLRNADLLSKQVHSIMRCPIVCDFGHRRRRGDRVDRCHIAERISDMADGCIAVYGHFFGH